MNASAHGVSEVEMTTVDLINEVRMPGNAEASRQIRAVMDSLLSRIELLEKELSQTKALHERAIKLGPLGAFSLP